MEIPSSVTSIGGSAFGGCRKISRVYIDDLTWWLTLKNTDYADLPHGQLYLDGEPLEEIRIPEGIQTIRNYAFCKCSASTSVTIPESVTSIGDSAFAQCGALTEILFQGDAPTIGASTFQDVTATAYYFPDKNWPEDKLQDYGGTLTWVPNAFTLHFDANGGSVSTASKALRYSEAYGALPTPERTGYSFIGWYTEPKGGEEVTAETILDAAESRTIYAHWTENGYTVSFNANGGSVSTTSKAVAFDAPYGALPTPERTGYTFTGWYTSSTGGTQVTAETTVTATSDHTLYAHWTANEYTVSFDPNGGSVDPASKAVTYDSSYGTLPTPERTGYSFQGWYTAAEGGSKISSGTIVVTTSDHTLYAQWRAKSYTLRVDGNGGYTNGYVGYYNKTVTYDEPYGTLGVGYRTGFSFDGWYTQSAGGDLVTEYTIVKRALDHTIYAHWTANSYTVSFDPNGGNVDMSSKTVTYAAPYGELPTPERRGYAFDGWYTASKGGKLVTGNMIVQTAEDHTLYAHWTVKTFTITLDPNGGSVEPGELSVTYDSPYGELPTPERTGYIFLGWYTAAESGEQVTGEMIVQTTEDHTLYAHWRIITHTIKFNADGGTGAPAEQTKFYGVTLTLPSAVPTRAGFTFLGWGTEQNALTAMYQPGESFTLEEDTVLYAAWKSLPPASTESAVLTLTDTTTSPGHEFEIDVKLENNPGLMVLSFRLDYDTELIEYLGGEDGTLTGWTFSKTGALWDGDQDSTETGRVARLRFRVKDGAPFRVTQIRVVELFAGNYNEENVALETVSGKVVISDRLPGDVTGDGKVNGFDLIRLRKYLAGEDVKIEAVNADVNGDGKVNGMDLIRLRRYLAGADVELQ